MIGSIVLSNVAIDRRRFHLGPLDLEIEAGTWVSIVGESGSGKTSLLGVISGLLRPFTGSVLIDGQDVTKFPPEKRACTTCQQESQLFPVYSVLDNIAFPLRAAGYSQSEARTIATERSEQFLVPKALLHSKPDSLSGGEARRVSICRAFMRPSKVILLDEVMNGLDEETQRVLLRFLEAEQTRIGATCLFVSHDPMLALMTASAAENRGSKGAVA